MRCATKLEPCQERGGRHGICAPLVNGSYVQLQVSNKFPNRWGQTGIKGLSREVYSQNGVKMRSPIILVWRPTQAPHCAFKPWAQDLEDRGFKFGSHALVGHQYERVLKDKHQEQRVFDRLWPEQQTALKCLKPQGRKASSDLRNLLQLCSSYCIDGCDRDPSKR